LAAIILTTVTFYIVSVFALTVLGAHSLLTYFETRPQVTAFFRDEATDTQVDTLRREIEGQVAVEDTQYIDKQQALEIYREQNADNPLLLEMVTADILPASLEISAKSVTDLEKVASLMSDKPYIEEVVFQKDVIDTLKNWVNGVRIGGVALSGLLLFASLVTIVIILGLKFTARKVEVNTLSLLGATPWYIRSPFVLEGIIYGMSGAALGWGLSFLTLLYLTPNLIQFLSDIPLLPVQTWIMLALLGGELALGLVLGTLASLIATRRYGR
jgi:cell division transport system permease protein